MAVLYYQKVKEKNISLGISFIKYKILSYLNLVILIFNVNIWFISIRFKRNKRKKVQWVWFLKGNNSRTLWWWNIWIKRGRLLSIRRKFFIMWYGNGTISWRKEVHDLTRRNLILLHIIRVIFYKISNSKKV